MPPPPLLDVLKRTQVHVNKALGGPEFPIHMTVAGGFACGMDEFEAICQEELADLPAISITLNGVETGETFHQSLFVAASVPASLKDLRRRICDRLPESKGAFYPHFSLYYGLASEDLKRAAMNDLPAFVGTYDCTSFALGAHNSETGEIYTERLLTT